ncbi:unnamed protein product [Pieris macdunnoughi]|uniref:Uncharacterized protein n=1 Tax=Pieris macdunnoughi TaxID=345717 RepID=A0A821XST1_9NEOP|nr:unnamed protein product [Pieris macdunnoughi]
MLDSLVRVSRRVLRVPETETSPTETRTVRDCAGCDDSGAAPASAHRQETGDDTNTCVGPDAREARARFESKTTVRLLSATVAVERLTLLRRRRSAPGPRLDSGVERVAMYLCTEREVHAVRGRRHARPVRARRNARASRRGLVRRGLTMNLSVRSFEFRRFTPERFHVLLNSLFKVLFNFPSRYLFAIGLAVIFSLRWSLPPT